MKIQTLLLLSLLSFGAFSQDLNPVITQEDRVILDGLFSGDEIRIKLENDKLLLKKVFNLEGEKITESREVTAEDMKLLDKLFKFKEKSKKNKEILDKLFAIPEDEL